jgi:NADH-quinone oxidoreductase subunit L
VLSVVGGWVGSARFDRFLSPVWHSDEAAYSTPDTPAATLTPQEHSDTGRWEMLFTSISVGAAILGLYLAWLLYLQRPQLPQQIAKGLGGFYQAVVHKYYVDELYAILFVKPLLDGSTRILWQGVDQNVIDAALDNSADGAREVSDSLRHMQSGNLRSYAAWIAAGAAVIIAYMIWMGTR